MNQIRDLVKKYDLFLFSDEGVSRVHLYGLSISPPAIWKRIENNVVLIDSVSKRYSECGYPYRCADNEEQRDTRCRYEKFRRTFESAVDRTGLPLSVFGCRAKTICAIPTTEYGTPYMLIDGLGSCPPAYILPIPMGAFYTVGQVAGRRFRTSSAHGVFPIPVRRADCFMAPASGFLYHSGFRPQRSAHRLRLEEGRFDTRVVCALSSARRPIRDVPE